MNGGAPAGNPPKILRNKLFKTLPVLHKNFEVSFEVYPTSLSGGWKNVIHLTVGQDHRKYGDRIPGIIFIRTLVRFCSIFKEDYYATKIFVGTFIGL